MKKVKLSIFSSGIGSNLLAMCQWSFKQIGVFLPDLRQWIDTQPTKTCVKVWKPFLNFFKKTAFWLELLVSLNGTVRAQNVKVRWGTTWTVSWTGFNFPFIALKPFLCKFCFVGGGFMNLAMLTHTATAHECRPFCARQRFSDSQEVHSTW